MGTRVLNELANLEKATLHWLNNVSAQGIFSTDAKLNIQSWNHWLEIHTGFPAEKMIGRNLLDVYPEIITRRLASFYNQALDGQVVILSQRLHRYLLPMPPKVTQKDTPAQMQQSVRIAPLLSGTKAIGTLTVIEDVTDRVERETELQRQIEELQRTQEILRQVAAENLRLARAVNSASDGIVITDPSQPDNPIIYTNAAFTRITGYQQEEVMGYNCRFLQGAETDKQTIEEIRQGIAQGRDVAVTVLNYRKNGEPFWNELKVSPVFSDEGQIIYYVGIQTDVSDRHRAEQKIAEQAALLNITRDTIIVQDLDSNILVWNKGAEHLYGWTEAEAIGKKANKLLFKEYKYQLDLAYKDVVNQGEWQGELYQIRQDGKPIVVESRWTLVVDENQQPKSILIVNTDITQKKQLESQFLRAQRMESIGTLAGGIAHDLNNVLTPILGATQLLQVVLDNQQAHHWLTIIENNAKRGAGLVKQVLSFARGAEGKPTLLQVGHLIWEIGDIVKETFPKAIDVNIDISPDLWMLSGDATQLHQVLMNLCVNARDAMPNGGNLSICAENIFLDQNYTQMNIEAKVGPYILITVADTGIGIPKEIIDRIFEPFFTTKELGKGSGLGLSTAMGIIKSHNGFVNVESSAKHGTKFKVYLPAVEVTETGKITTAKLAREKQGQGELILVVDDEIGIREITETTLQTYNYKVLTAGDGVEAIATYASNKDAISIVLLDMMMPVMDGITTVRTLKKMNPHVKIVISTGLAAKDKISEAVSLGVKTFLAKPYTAEELLTTISQLLKDNQPS